MTTQVPQLRSLSASVQNRTYELRHVEADSGFGLLYSSELDDSILLSPVGVALWEAADGHESSTEPPLLTAAHGVAGGDAYVATVLAQLREEHILLPATETATAGHETRTPASSSEVAPTTPPLRQIYVYCTLECNSRCYHCYLPIVKVGNEPRDLQRGQVSAARLVRLFEDAIPLGLKRVKVTGGEALLRKDLPQILSGARGLGLAASIETNGFLLDEAYADFLAEHQVGVSISLDGGSAVVHDKLRGLKGGFAGATRALRLLAERGVEPHVIASISSLNIEHLESILEAAAATGCRQVKLNPVNTLGRAQRLGGKKRLMSVHDIIRLHENRDALERRFGVMLVIEGPPAFASIYRLLTRGAGMCPFTNILGVLPDGGLSFCGVGICSPELVFGRIDDPSFDLERLWTKSEYLVRVRRALRKPIAGICSRCVLEPVCKGSCRALAHGSFGSLTSAHPWCQEAYDEGVFPSHYLRGDEEEADQISEPAREALLGTF